MREWSLSVPKNSVVIFTRKRRIPDVTIVCNNQRVPVLNCEVLGCASRLSAKLSDSPHMEYVSNKCEKKIQILRAVSGV